MPRQKIHIERTVETKYNGIRGITKTSKSSSIFFKIQVLFYKKKVLKISSNPAAAHRSVNQALKDFRGSLFLFETAEEADLAFILAFQPPRLRFSTLNGTYPTVLSAPVVTANLPFGSKYVGIWRMCGCTLAGWMALSCRRAARSTGLSSKCVCLKTDNEKS